MSDCVSPMLMVACTHPQLLDILGKGASSYVQKARHTGTGQMMALKVINVFDKDKRHQLMKEIKTLHTANCPNLVSFYGAFFKDGQISLGLELMDCGSLHDIMQRVGKVPEAALAQVSKQVLVGLDYLHSTRHQIHRDIKVRRAMPTS
jgi:serine/threonine protein kinase